MNRQPDGRKLGMADAAGTAFGVNGHLLIPNLSITSRYFEKKS